MPLLTLYRWISLAEKAGTSVLSDKVQPLTEGLASALSGPLNLSSLKTSLQGPDFGLALAIAPALDSNLQKNLQKSGRALRRLIGGGREPVPDATKQIAHVASLLARGPILLSDLLKVMRSRRSLLNLHLENFILADNGDKGLKVEELFSELFERLVGPHSHRTGGPASATLSYLYHAFFNMVIPVGMMSTSQVRAEVTENITRLFNFMEHPLIQMALTSYVGLENMRSHIEGPAFKVGHFLHDRYSHWAWVVTRPAIEIVMDIK